MYQEESAVPSRLIDMCEQMHTIEYARARLLCRRERCVPVRIVDDERSRIHVRSPSRIYATHQTQQDRQLAFQPLPVRILSRRHHGR